MEVADMFTGVAVNFAAVAAGSLIGLFFKNKLKEKYHTALVDAIALGVISIGASYVIKTENILVLIISLIAGTLAGTFLGIDERLDSLGERLKKRLKSEEGAFSEGFAGASILFCVGSMAVLGCLGSALSGDDSILLTKSVMDGVSAVFLASALGAGVFFSAFSVLLYQGLLTLLFRLFAGGLDPAAINEMSAAGGAILIGIAFNMLGIKKIKAADMVLSLFIPLALLPLMKLLGA